MIQSCNFRKIDGKYLLWILYVDKRTGKTNQIEHVVDDFRDVMIMIESCATQEEIHDYYQLSLEDALPKGMELK